MIADGKIVGMLDEAHITRAYHDYLGRLGEGIAPSSVAPLTESSHDEKQELPEQGS